MGKNSGAIKAAFVSCEGEDTKSPTVESTRNNKIVCRGTEEVAGLIIDHTYTILGMSAISQRGLNPNSLPTDKYIPGLDTAVKPAQHQCPSSICAAY